MIRLLSIFLAASAVLTNSTTETVIGSALGTTQYIVPANAWQAGKVYRVEGSVRAVATNSTDTLRIRVRLGPTTLTGTVVFDSAAVDVANDDVVTFSLTFVARTVTSSSTVVVRGHGGTLGAAGTATHRNAHAIVTALDLTAAQRIEVTAAWSVASAGNQCQLETFEVYEIS